MRKVLGELLKPDYHKVLSTLLLLAFLMAAYIQSCAFVDDVPEVTKPPLYDLLRPFNLWAPAMLLIMPMALLTLPLQQVGFSALLAPLAWPLQAIYVYCLSCLLVLGHDRWGRKLGRFWRWFVWIMPFFAVAAPYVSGIFTGASWFWKAVPLFVSSILFTECVLSIYAYIAVCFGIDIYQKLRA